MITSNDVYAKHMANEAVTPSLDFDAWWAYLTLSLTNPNITYLSYDGYHVHGLADYKQGVVWQGNRIICWETKEVILDTGDFQEVNTPYIIKTWNNAITLSQKEKAE